jgi:hypothetical protein
MEEYGYAREKLWAALDTLVGDGTIQYRLGNALTQLVRLRPKEDFPEELREEFSTLMADLTKRVIHSEWRSSWINTRRPKSGRMAKTVLSLYISLRGGI